MFVLPQFQNRLFDLTFGKIIRFNIAKLRYFAKIKLRPTYYKNLGVTIGEGTKIRSGVKIDGNPNNLKIGEKCFINCNVLFDCYGIITIGNNVGIAYNVIFITSSHEYELNVGTGKHIWSNIAINDNVWICGGAIIYPGVTIGEGAVISAGAVVTRDVPANSLYAGNPARNVRWIEKERAKDNQFKSFDGIAASLKI